MALKNAVRVLGVSYSHYLHAHNELQVENAAGSLYVQRSVARRHSVERNGGAWRVAKLLHQQLLTIDVDRAPLRRVALLPLYSWAIKPTKWRRVKSNVVHYLKL